MIFLEFRNQLFDLACFNIYQVYAWQPDFDQNNLTSWTKKGYFIPLRQGDFAFRNIRASRIIPFILPTGFTARPTSACIRHYHSTG